jgi:hypothetical protein
LQVSQKQRVTHCFSHCGEFGFRWFNQKNGNFLALG